MKFKFLCPLDKPVIPSNVVVRRQPPVFLDEIPCRVLDEIGTAEGSLTEAEAIAMIPRVCLLWELQQLIPEGFECRVTKCQ